MRRCYERGGMRYERDESRKGGKGEEVKRGVWRVKSAYFWKWTKLTFKKGWNDVQKGLN